jgi:hypothetical protein
MNILQGKNYQNVSLLPVAQSYTVNVNISPPGSGTVTVSPQPPYIDGETITFTAVPASGYHFSNWVGYANPTANPATGPIHGDINLTANFLPVGGHSPQECILLFPDLYAAVIAADDIWTSSGQAFMALDSQYNAINNDWANYLVTHPLGQNDPSYIDLFKRRGAAYQLNESYRVAFEAANAAFYNACNG